MLHLHTVTGSRDILWSKSEALLRHNTCRPWDKGASTGKSKPIPLGKSDPLSTDERRTFVEWIDMGALWDGIPGPDGQPAEERHIVGETP